MDRSYTAQLAAYAAEWTEEKLTPAIVERAREIVLDTLGALLLGAGPEYGAVRRLAELARETGGPPRCTAIAQGFRTDVLSALLINGTAGYAADVEGAGVGRQHAAAVLVPTVLTLGEYVGASGRRAIAALALAYDIAARIDDAAATAHSYPHSFHPSAVFGHFGAAVTAGCLLGLDADGFERALGLAGLNAGGLIVWVNDPAEEARPFVIGVAAQAGARAALLAGRGYGGPLGVADPGKYDIYDAFSGECRPERLTAGLGEEFRLLTAGGYKRYPCCGDIHTGLDALLAILQRHDLPPERIARIVHAVHPERRAVIDGNPLRSHCAQYILAVAAVERRITPDVILVDRRATDARVAALAGRVTLIADEAFRSGAAGAPAWVELETTDGATYREAVAHARGARQNPLTPGEIRAKFDAFAGERLGAERAAAVAALVDRLETLPDIGELMAALT
jgi:2-methylcitrate dehydratase PrpD